MKQTYFVLSSILFLAVSPFANAKTGERFYATGKAPIGSKNALDKAKSIAIQNAVLRCNGGVELLAEWIVFNEGAGGSTCNQPIYPWCDDSPDHTTVARGLFQCTEIELD